MGNIHQRVNGRVPRLPRRHCSSLYAEPDAGRVCLNTHVIYIHFSLLLCFFFFFPRSNLAEMEVRYFWQLWTLWRQHRGDRVSLFAAISHHIRMPFSPSFHGQTERGRLAQRKVRMWDWKGWICAIVSLFDTPFCADFYNIKTLFLAESANCHFYCDDKKISISHKGVIITSVRNNTEDINQFPSGKARGKAHLSSSPMFHSGVSLVCGG